MLKIGSFQSYSTSVPDYSAAYELMCDLESAARQEDWPTVLDLLQQGPTIEYRRDDVLRNALERLGSEDVCLCFLRAARTQGALLPRTDQAILELATKRDYRELASEQLNFGNQEPFAADQSLQIAAKDNRAALVRVFLESNICTQDGKNKAALAAAENGALDFMLELLKTNSINGGYTHPVESYLDHQLGPLTECIWSVLIRESSIRGHWDIANAVQSYKPFELTEYDLCFLAIAAASAGKKDALEEIMTRVSLKSYHGCSAYQAAKRNGHDEIVSLLEPYAPTRR